MAFKQKIIASLIVGGGALAATSPALANDSDELEKLRALVQELDQKISVLDRKSEIAEEEAAAKKNQTPIVSASDQGFGIKSVDGNFELRLRGQVQTDGRYYPGGDGFASGNSDATAQQAPNTFLLKQFRPALQGALWGKYDFLLLSDFAGGKTVVQDAYVDAKFVPWFQLKAGKQKTPFGIERLQGESDGKFIERALPNDLVPNRDIGVQVHGKVANDTVEYALGYFNGVIDGGSSDSFSNSDTDNNTDKDFVARVFTTPFKNEPGFLQGLGFGIAATYGDQRGSGTGASSTAAQTSTESLLPSFKSALGQLTFFKYRTASAGAADGTYGDGERLRWSPQFYYYNGPFGLLGEYVRVSQDVSRNLSGNIHRHDTLDNDAWQIVASWLLTGEVAGYTNPLPKRPFDLEKGTGLGAWELVARYSEVNVDDKAFDPFGTGSASTTQGRSYADPRAAVRKASAWAGGVNWYLNKNIKLALDYEETSFDGGWTDKAGSAYLDRPTEKVLSTRLQVAF
ncbi:phosphate-selective porin OprO and OprP [Novimethylophilus kurashikiensis]|uniref:Phosphate-selective porin OprO and OprP n=1 Tax=Novimethylophilus kurashikiensis TaxID=1825523 RepID=A0A2R5FC62_9PROT|nr:porin [Novimethylophilus kurashikiensis]GBG15802.1 phosphate-selective porin OprO and OprP [Novimethylophilus kurashikiensis]